MQPPRVLTAAEVTYNHICDLIVRGELRPGAHLDQDQLCAALSISRTPIRQAIERLAKDGLVEYRPRQGAVVTPISRRQMLEIYAIRAHNEGWAAMLAAARLTFTDAESLQAVCEAAETALAEDDVERHMQLNRDFHLLIYRCADLPTLYGIIENLWIQSERYRRLYAVDPRRLLDAQSEHRQILDALRRHDGELAKRLTVAHQYRTLEVLLKNMPEDGEEPDPRLLDLIRP